MDTGLKKPSGNDFSGMISEEICQRKKWEVVMLAERMKIRHYYFIMGVLLVAILLILGCQKEDTTEPVKGTPPEIPPLSTFLMDFDSFPDTSGSLLGKEALFNKTLSHQNWGWAAINVAVWNSLLTITFA
ncbi:MAG: hypothetical protein D6748_00660, partial [Calditrichaeota bacterium]